MPIPIQPRSTVPKQPTRLERRENRTLGRDDRPHASSPGLDQGIMTLAPFKINHPSPIETIAPVHNNSVNSHYLGAVHEA